MKKQSALILIFSLVFSFSLAQKAMCEEVTAGNYISHTLDNVKAKVADMNQKTEDTEKTYE